MSQADGTALPWLASADRTAPWSEAKVVVAGIGASGFAAADALLEADADVIVLDESENPSNLDRANLLRELGADVTLGPGATANLPPEIDLVIASPGWRPTAPLLSQAVERGVPVWSEVELAWRFSHPDRVVPWLGITGTNGKTTTTQMLDAILRAAGRRPAMVGNVGRPVMEAVLDSEAADVFVVELSSFQLHWSHTLALHSAAVLNLQPDHLEWYAHTDDPMASYVSDKAKIYERVTHAAVYNVADPATERLVEEAEVTQGARAIGFTLGTPGMSMLGVVDDLLVDRAFVAQRKDSALEVAQLSDVRPYAPHNVENALAAAALARSLGVPAQAVGEGLRTLELGEHRIQTVGVADGITWVNDSKATNPHAAEAALASFESVVWIAGGQAKGTSFDELIVRHAAGLRGVVLLGVDRHVIAEALARHAPEIPVIDIASTETGAMTQVVAAAQSLAQPSDVILLAPGCASLDMFASYGERGTAFVDAVLKAIEPAKE